MLKVHFSICSLSPSSYIFKIVLNVIFSGTSFASFDLISMTSSMDDGEGDNLNHNNTTAVNGSGHPSPSRHYLRHSKEGNLLSLILSCLQMAVILAIFQTRLSKLVCILQLFYTVDKDLFLWNMTQSK